MTGFAGVRKGKRFIRFYDRYYRCSASRYDTSAALLTSTFDYNFYITGSDQVWNPRHIRDDCSFFLPFVPDGVPRISYASSFSTDRIEDRYAAAYASLLKQYQRISIREESGLKIVKELTGRDAALVCDPTLLLTKEEWSDIALRRRRPRIRKPYILVYILRYAYEPYPEIDRIITRIQEQSGLHLVFMDGTLHNFMRRDASVVKDAGPLEFLRLIEDASFMITTSFHGTAFALNMEVPFYSVIESRDCSDSRITSLLDLAGVPERAVVYNSTENACDLSMDFTEVRARLARFRAESLKYLSDSLQRR